MNKALRVMAALGMLLAALAALAALASGAGEPHPGDPGVSVSSSLSASGLDNLTGPGPGSYYGHAPQYAAAAREAPANRSSRQSSLRPARTPRFDISTQEISRLMLYLNTDHSIQADLTLCQSGETIFGRGNMTSGNSTKEVGVTGAMSHDHLALDLVTLDGDLYRINLQGNGQSLSGEYIATNSKGAAWSGRATGRPNHQS